MSHLTQSRDLLAFGHAVLAGIAFCSLLGGSPDAYSHLPYPIGDAIFKH